MSDTLSFGIELLNCQQLMLSIMKRRSLAVDLYSERLFAGRLKNMTRTNTFVKDALCLRHGQTSVFDRKQRATLRF